MEAPDPRRTELSENAVISLRKHRLSIKTLKPALLPDKKRWYLPRWIKIAIIVLSGFFLLMMATALVIQHRMKEIIILEINKQLVVKVSVDELSFSVLRSFPSASLSFSNVRVPSPDPHIPDLLNAGSLSLRFSILDLLKKNYSIRYIEIRNGKLNIWLPEGGEPNYLILQPGDGEQSSEVAFALKKVRIRDVDLVYHDPGNKLEFNAYGQKLLLRGDFSSDEYRLSLAGNLRVDKIGVGNDGFFSGQDAVIDLSMHMDNRRSVYTIRKGNLEMEGLPFSVDGWVEHHAGAKRIAIHCKGNRIGIGHLMGLLPDYQEEVMRDYLPRGEISFTGSIEGSYAGKDVPAIRFDYGMDDCSVKHRKTGVAVDMINAKGSYIYTYGNSAVALDQFSLRIGSGFLKGSVSLKELDAPAIALNVEGAMDLQELTAFFPTFPVEAKAGKLSFRLKGNSKVKLNDLLSVTHLQQSHAEGELVIENASTIKNDQYPEIEGLSGKFSFDNNDVRVTNLKANINRSDLEFSGYLRNLFPYLLMSGQELEFNGTLQSRSADIKSLLFSGTGSATSGSSNTVSLPGRIRGIIDVEIGSMQYGAFVPSQVRGRVTLTPGKILAEQVSLRACGGLATGQVLLSALTDGRFHFDAALQTDRTDIKQLFRQFSNFGQNDLTDKHLEGMLTSRIRVQSYLKPDLNFDLNTLEAIGELMVERGALLNYAPVEALAKYTRLDDLSNIRFNTLRNEIRISKRKIVIPEMMIRTDALDLSLAGTHTFSGDISYQIRVLLSELLSRRTRKSFSMQDDESVESDHRGRMTLHLLIEGTVDNPVVRYDRKKHRINLQKDIRTEKEELKDLFKREFGTFNRQIQPKEQPTGRNKPEVIVIEWDDD